jgi:hypothetical protein
LLHVAVCKIVLSLRVAPFLARNQARQILLGICQGISTPSGLMNLLGKEAESSGFPQLDANLLKAERGFGLSFYLCPFAVFRLHSHTCSLVR